MITIYECEVCGEQYKVSSRCLECENKPLHVARYKVGDVVYLPENNRHSDAKGFVKTAIVAVGIIGHDVRYELEHYIGVGCDISVGGAINSWSDDRWGGPAYESYIFQLGDTDDCYLIDTPLTIDMVAIDADLTTTDRSKD